MLARPKVAILDPKEIEHGQVLVSKSNQKSVGLLFLRTFGEDEIVFFELLNSQGFSFVYEHVFEDELGDFSLLTLDSIDKR